MKGLLLKDWYMMKMYMRTYLAMLVIFIGVSVTNTDNLFFIFYPCMLCGMIPTSLLAYDERGKWDVYADTMPCPRRQVVSAKYLLGAMLLAVVLILTGLVQGITMAVSGTSSLEDLRC